MLLLQILVSVIAPIPYVLPNTYSVATAKVLMIDRVSSTNDGNDQKQFTRLYECVEEGCVNFFELGNYFGPVTCGKHHRMPKRPGKKFCTSAGPFNPLSSHSAQGHFTPAVYVLMEKSSLSYELLFKQVSQLLADWTPLSVISNFDNDLIQSIRKTFPETDVTGSHFHFKQILMRHSNFVMLSYKPPKQVVECFNQLKNEYDDQIFTDYFHANFIDQDAPFSLNFWNIHDNLKQSLAIASDIEYWHNYFAHRLISNENWNDLTLFLEHLKILDRQSTDNLPTGE
ncbi:unnamed protein product [Didymodactylos carnosus]|uniref:Transposase n=1 Tax=Didymodactylos carnosus TaxID=1234261 RepID=A0A814XGF5_9BILA|nr:unnamed protein product [Didymodactylos carnosus]CAF3978628.1 unnamed protein product [Didymodactylos carnosus]